MTSNASIVQGMADALPTHQKDEDSSDLASSYEAVALLVHAHLASLGFRLFGFDEEKPLRMPFLRLLGIYLQLGARC